MAARAAQDGIARRGVPFHGAAKAGVQVGLARRDEAELEA